MANKASKNGFQVQYTRERGGPVFTAHLIVDINFDDVIARIGKRAAMSMGKKAIECGGAVVVRVTSTDEPQS